MYKISNKRNIKIMTSNIVKIICCVLSSYFFLLIIISDSKDLETILIGSVLIVILMLVTIFSIKKIITTLKEVNLLRKKLKNGIVIKDLIYSIEGHLKNEEYSNSRFYRVKTIYGDKEFYGNVEEDYLISESGYADLIIDKDTNDGIVTFDIIDTNSKKIFNNKIKTEENYFVNQKLVKNILVEKLGKTILFIAILIVILVAVIIGGILEIKDNNFNIMSKISISAVSITVLYNLYHLFKNFSKWWNLMRKGEILSNKQFSTLGSYIILVEHELLTGSKIKFVRNL